MKEKKLGGVMFWSLDSDDFNGEFCGQGKYPLIKSVLNIIQDEKEFQDIIKPYNYTADDKTMEIEVKYTNKHQHRKNKVNKVKFDSLEKCPNGDGFYTDFESECTEYHICIFSGTPDENVQYLKCPHNLAFDLNLKACNFKSMVKCEKLLQNKPSNKCKSDGIFIKKNSGCKKYFFCAFSNSKYAVVHEYSCKPGTLFNEKSQECEKDFKCKIF